MSDFALLTPDEAAEFLRVSRTQLYKLRREEGLPYVKLGGRTLFKRDALVEFVNQNQKVNENG